MSEHTPEDSTVPENMKGDLNDPSEPDTHTHDVPVEREVERTESESSDGATEKTETVKERLSPDDDLQRNPVDGDDPRSRNYEKDL